MDEEIYINELEKSAREFLTTNHPSHSLEGESLEGMMMVIETHAIVKNDAKAIEFLKEVEWSVMTVPDPYGWASRW